MKKIALTLLLFSLCACSKEEPYKFVPPPVSIARAKKMDAPLFRDYVGHVEPILTVNVRPRVDGVIMKQYFREGDYANSDDVLFLIDPRPFEARLAQAEAAVAVSRANLAFSQEKVRRYAPLVQEDYISQLDFDQYVTQVQVDEATLQENLAAAEWERLNLYYCKVRSPIEGLTGQVMVDVGNFVQAGNSDPLILINQIAPIYVSFYVPERELPLLQKAYREQGPLKTIAYFSEDHKHGHEGLLSMINNEVNEKTGTILMRSNFENKEHGLWPGEFVDVRLIYGYQKDAIIVPAEAVQVGQKDRFVWVIGKDKRAHAQLVTVGQREDETWVIENGIEEGTIVVTEGQLNLFEGIPVTVKNNEEDQK